MRAVASDRNVATVTGLYTAQAFIAGALNVLVVLVAFELIDAGESGVGYLSAALGIGGFVGGFVALVLATRGRLAADFGVGVVLFGIPFAVIGIFASYPVALLAFAVVGIGNSVADIAALTLFQRIVPDHVLGRVLGVLEGILLGAIGLGGLAAPLCIAVIGTKPSLLVAGIAAARGDTARRGPSARDRPDDRGDRPTRPCCVACRCSASCRSAVLEFLARPQRPCRPGRRGDRPRGRGLGDRFYVIESGEVGDPRAHVRPRRVVRRDRAPARRAANGDRDRGHRRLARRARARHLRPAVTGHGPAHATAEEVVAERLGSFSPLLS